MLNKIVQAVIKFFYKNRMHKALSSFMVEVKQCEDYIKTHQYADTYIETLKRMAAEQQGADIIGVEQLRILIAQHEARAESIVELIKILDTKLDVLIKLNNEYGFTS